jgi:hypothetical protein
MRLSNNLRSPDFNTAKSEDAAGNGGLVPSPFKNALSGLSKRSWNSPTLTAWFSRVNNTASFLLLTPLLLRYFDATEIAVFYLFQSLSGLVSLIDFGFGPTFSRFLAYGRGGRRIEDLEDLRMVEGTTTPIKTNWSTVEQVVTAMRVIYARLAIAALAMALLIGPFLLIRPISQVPNPADAWLAFALVALSSARVIYRRVYENYLRGMNHMALVNRWEALTGSLGVISGVVVILLGGKLLAIVVSLQFWALVAAARNRWLAFHVDGGRFRGFPRRRPDPQFMRLVSSKAWRSGIGSAALSGFSQSFGFVIAQFVNAQVVAQYLFASKTVDSISKFAMAGFGPKLPTLAAFRAAGRVRAQMALAKRGMVVTHWAFAIPIILLGLSGPWLLHQIHSSMEFPVLLWCLLALKEQMLRTSLMHMQLYQLTNDIVAHKAMVIVAAGQAIACCSLFPLLQVYALPVGAIIGTLLPMVWLWRLSCSSMNVSFWKFESSISLVPILVSFLMIAYAALH